MVAIAAAEQADNASGLAVVAAPESNKFEFLGDRLGKAEGGLDRLCAAREQLDVGDPFRQQAADQIEKARPRFGRETAEGDALELLLKALNVVRMAVADDCRPRCPQ